MKYTGNLYGKVGKTYLPLRLTSEDVDRIERERDAFRAWIAMAAPLMESAVCIAIEENVDRLDEIPGCQAIMEMCPVEWERMPHLARSNDQVEARRDRTPPQQ